MTAHRTLVASATCFMVGVWLASAVPGVYSWVVFVVAGGLLASSGVLYRSGKKHAAAWCFSLVFVCLGVVRLGAHLEQVPDITSLLGTTSFDGVVVEEPDVRADKQLLTVTANGHSGRVLVTLTPQFPYRYGDQVRVTGKLTEPKVFDDFDYAAYLARFGVYAVSYRPQVLVVGQGGGSSIRAGIFTVRRWFVSKLSERLPGAEGDLLLGILLGQRTQLAPALVESFRTTGTSHLVAVSGYNVSVLAAALVIFAPLLGRRRTLWLSAVLVLGFTIAAGASASVVRAAIMGCLVLVAQGAGRQYRSLPTLTLAAACMVLVTPRLLWWDVGFQLSALATYGIVVFTEPIQSALERVRAPKTVATHLATTLAASVAALPIVLHTFGTLSFISPLANVLVLPVVPVAMLFGAAAVLPLVGTGFAFVALWPLRYVSLVVTWLSRVPHAAMVAPLPAWGVYLWLSALAVLSWVTLRRAEPGPVEVNDRAW